MLNIGTLIPILTLIAVGAYLLVKKDPSKLPRIKKVLIFEGVMTVVTSITMIYTITSMGNLLN
jgi:hypothetical protein